MENTLYKFLDINGFRGIVEEEKLKFSNLNEWKKSGDVFENYFVTCFEREDEFNRFINACMQIINDKGKIKMLLSYLYHISMNTYALSLSKVENRNSMAMWQIYGDKCCCKVCPLYIGASSEGYGIKIEFDVQLYSELKEKNKEYSFQGSAVQYQSRECLPTISQIMQLLYEEEWIKKLKELLYFQKIDSYSFEVEYRYLITKISNWDVIGIRLMDYAKGFELTYDSFLENKEAFFKYDSSDAVFLKGDLKKYIKSVEVSPEASNSFIEKVGDICEEHRLNYLGKSRIKEFDFLI